MIKVWCKFEQNQTKAIQVINTLMLTESRVCWKQYTPLKLRFAGGTTMEREKCLFVCKSWHFIKIDQNHTFAWILLSKDAYHKIKNQWFDANLKFHCLASFGWAVTLFDEIVCKHHTTITNIMEPDHEKICLIPYANNKGANQPAHLPFWSVPLSFTA